MANQGRVEFASGEWLDRLRAAVQQQLEDADLSGIDYCVSEEFTGAPPHLLTGGSDRLGWHLRVHDGRVEILDYPLDDADVRLVIDYATALPIARTVYAGNPETRAAAQERMAAAAANGQFELVGDKSLAPGPIAALNLHDALAPQTL